MSVDFAEEFQTLSEEQMSKILSRLRTREEKNHASLILNSRGTESGKYLECLKYVESQEESYEIK